MIDRNELPDLLEEQAAVIASAGHAGWGNMMLMAAAALRESEEWRRDAQRWRAVRELDGGAIYSLLGDCDGMHPEQADAAIDAARKEGV